MRAKEIISIFEEFAPSNIQESWDNSGLMVGDVSMEVNKVLLSLDFTEQLVEEAIECGANMIITHHPLLFKGVKKIGTDTYIERIITKLIKNDIIAYSMHTNIDKVPRGVSGLMADRIGLINQEVLESESQEEIGLGIVGNLKVPLSVEDFITMLKKQFSLKCLKSSAPIDSHIKRVALCGGSGSSLISSAIKSGAQVYISGDISYHNFFCEKDFMIIDIGHYESEIEVLDLMMNIILKKMPNFAVRKSEINNNPIYYH